LNARIFAANISEMINTGGDSIGNLGNFHGESRALKLNVWQESGPIRGPAAKIL
jgi:hypothetical protein